MFPTFMRITSNFSHQLTHQCPAATAPPCWMRRALCMLREGTGTLPCQQSSHRQDPSRSSYRDDRHTGSCVERSTAAAPGRNPASRGAHSGRCRNPCLWMRTPVESGNPWWPKWSSQPRGAMASSPRRQVKLVYSFSVFFFGVWYSLEMRTVQRSTRTVWSWRSQNSLDAAARLSTVAAPNPARAPNYRARRAEPSRAGQRGVDVSFSLARLLAPCLCPEAKTVLTVACLAPVFSPQKPPVSFSPRGPCTRTHKQFRNSSEKCSNIFPGRFFRSWTTTKLLEIVDKDLPTRPCIMVLVITCVYALALKVLPPIQMQIQSQVLLTTHVGRYLHLIKAYFLKGFSFFTCADFSCASGKINSPQ